jgi:ketosteroid isomerase-like protein
VRAPIFAVAAATLIVPSLPAQPASAAARAAIDAGNQAWVDGVKAGDIKRILATYTHDAVDCGPTGECTRGLQEIEQHMTAQLSNLGRARSARVTTWGSSEHADFVYEWGQAEAVFEGGKKLVDKYLTVWQHQPDGTWKIFRNMVIRD